MSFTAASVTRPAPPTITLNVRRRDSHHRKILAVLRTSAGAGKSKRVRADTPVLRTATTQHTSSEPLHQVLCVVELYLWCALELPVVFVVSSSTSSLTRDRPAPAWRTLAAEPSPVWRREDARVLVAHTRVRARSVPAHRPDRNLARLRERVHDRRHVRSARPTGRRRSEAPRSALGAEVEGERTGWGSGGGLARPR